MALCGQGDFAMRTVKLALVAAFALGAATAGIPAAGHAATTDGNWNVTIITEKGSCDRAYSYNVDVSHGRVVYRGSSFIKLAGTVAPDGLVKVNISAGKQGANGTGRLSGSEGAGVWRGRGTAGECAGRWEAVRR
jgi:hypothetical protein